MNLFSKFTKSNSISSGAIIIASFAVLSKILGLARYSLIASKFGTGPIADSYLAAFRIPDFIYGIMVLGALSTAFIPVFLDLHDKNKISKDVGPQDLSVESSEEGLASVNIDHQKQLSSAVAVNQPKVKLLSRFKRIINQGKEPPYWELTNTLLNTLLIILLITSGIIWIFAPFLTAKLVPGFDAERLALTVKLTRIMLLSPIIFAVSNIFGSILQAFRRFTLFAAAPVMYNLGIICGILLGYPLFGPIGLAYGVILGAILHLLIQMPQVFQMGFCWRPILAWQSAGFKRVFRLILPRALALSANQVNNLVNTFLASGLAAGSVAVFYNAYDLQSLPISLIAVSLAVASFPVLGELFTKNNIEDFRHVLFRVIKNILLMMIPLTLFMILLRAQIIRLILGYGKYNWEDTVRTLRIFAVLSISLIAQGLIPILARAFYAREDTRTPVLISLVSIGLNIILAFILVRFYDLLGLAIAFSIASTANCVLLWLVLNRQIKGMFDPKIVKIILKYAVAAGIGGCALYINLYLIAALIGTERVWSLLIQTSFSFLIGAGAYLAALWILGEEAAVGLLQKARRWTR